MKPETGRIGARPYEFDTIAVHRLTVAMKASYHAKSATIGLPGHRTHSRHEFISGDASMLELGKAAGLKNTTRGEVPA